MAKYQGTGTVSNSDFKKVKYVGKTKSGKALTITLTDAINMGNIDWAFAEKGETVAEVTFTACYNNTDEAATSTAEPWTVEVEAGVTEGADEIICGVGIFYIGENAVALTRGGGKFTVTREFRNINADGDRGPVKGRIALDGSTATLTLSALQILTKITDLYAGIETATE